MPSKAQLLLIDNDPDSILQITQVLEPEGYDIGVATNIHQAFSQIRDDDPNLILIDISSKKVDSLALCRRIKQSPV
jgi:two-component system, sensor histidine kinase and response regulator